MGLATVRTREERAKLVQAQDAEERKNKSSVHESRMKSDPEYVARHRRRGLESLGREIKRTEQRLSARVRALAQLAERVQQLRERLTSVTEREPHRIPRIREQLEDAGEQRADLLSAMRYDESEIVRLRELLAKAAE
jgi:hypothetical protein